MVTNGLNLNALNPQRRGTVLITAHDGCSASGASPCCCGPRSAALGGVGRFSPSCSLGARHRAARPQGGGPCGPLPSAWNIYAESLNFFCVEIRLFSPTRLFVHRCTSIGMHLWVLIIRSRITYFLTQAVAALAPRSPLRRLPYPSDIPTWL